MTIFQICSTKPPCRAILLFGYVASGLLYVECPLANTSRIDEMGSLGIFIFACLEKVLILLWPQIFTAAPLRNRRSMFGWIGICSEAMKQVSKWKQKRNQMKPKRKQNNQGSSKTTLCGTMSIINAEMLPQKNKILLLGTSFMYNLGDKSIQT